MSVVSWPARKSHWLSGRITPLCWTCYDSRLSTTRAIILPAMENSEIPRWLSQQALFPFHLNVHYPGILEILRNRFLVPCPFTQLRETLKQLFTAMLLDLISEGIESALGDLPEDICWIVHQTSATNGSWPIYELPRPTLGSHQAQYCQRPTADSARIGNVQPRTGIDKSLCHHSSPDRERVPQGCGWILLPQQCSVMLALMTILITAWDWAVAAFGRLTKCLWHNHGIRGSTKIVVYRAVVLTALLYGCDSWTLYRRHNTEARFSSSLEMSEENSQYIMTGNDSQ